MPHLHLLALTMIPLIAAASCAPAPGPLRTASHSFDQLDTDNDNRISAQEYAATTRNDFEILDFNGDSTLTRQEYEDPFQPLHKNRNEQLEKQREALEKQLRATTGR